jgi:DNA-binding transcriptional LysR family regulator
MKTIIAGLSMSKLPDFEGLAMFAKVAEERSYAAAARAMGVSVATVSRTVSRLEDRLGGRLFNRSSRSLALTDLGASLVERAGRIYAEAEEAETLARDASARPRGIVRLAVPMSFGVRWVAPVLPDFFQLYPDVAIDLHLGDAKTDLIADGFDAALRIAVLEDSALVARLIAPVHRYILAAPAYIARFGQPHHPDDLVAHHCLGYFYRAQRDIWHFTNTKGETASVMPTGPLRVTNVDALLPTLLAGQAIAELPEFIAAEHVASGALQIILADWKMALGGLYFVTPTARARAAKIAVLSDFLLKRLSSPVWRIEGP